MHRHFALCATACAVILGSSVPRVHAQTLPSRDISPGEFREVLMNWAGVLDSRSRIAGDGSGGNLSQIVDSASEPQLMFWYERLPKGQRLALRSAVDRINLNRTRHDLAPGNSANPGLQAHREAPLAGSSLPASMYTPQYPSGSTYEAFVATLGGSGLGALSDSNGDGHLNDERCSDDFEAGVGIASAVAGATLAIFESICEVIPSPGKEVCYGAKIVASAFDVATTTVEAQCSYQDGAVDSAEIQAGYQNTRAIFENLSAHDVNLQTHAADIKSRLATHDTEIKAGLSLHDTTSKAALGTHDADIKDLLGKVRGGITNVQTTVESNQAAAFRLQIEQELLQAGRGGIGSLELPNAVGGFLEDVRSVVVDTIDKFRGAGLSVGAAASELQNADSARNAKDYKAAFTGYRNAYRLAVQ